MKLHELKPAEGSVKKRKRIGRGQGSGKGGTSTRGHKGAKARSGYSKKIGFEGGQMPLQRRVPKFGFNNPNKVTFRVINLDVIQKMIDEKGVKSIDIDSLKQSGLASSGDKIKILGRGELKGKVDVKVNAISDTAKIAIEGKGGKVELV